VKVRLHNLGLFAAALATALSTTASAETLAYEGFGYQSTSLHLQTGGLGFAGPWNSDLLVQPDGLVPTSFPVSPTPGYAYNDRVYHLGGRSGSRSLDQAAWMNLGGPDTLFVSFLFKRYNTGDPFDVLDCGIEFRSGSSVAMYIGGVNNDTTFGARVYPHGGNGGDILNGRVYFIVARIKTDPRPGVFQYRVYGPGETVAASDADVDAANDWTEFDLYGSSFTFTSTAIIDSIRLKGSASYSIDEFRIGTDWYSVTHATVPRFGTVSGRITRQGYVGTSEFQAMLEFRDANTGQQLFTRSVQLSPSGDYDVEWVREGEYQLSVKLPNWLRSTLPAVLVTESGAAADFVLINGDADGSNVVDILDLNLVLANFGWQGTQGGSGDLDWDGQVALADLNLILTNFGLVGDD